MKTEVVMKRPFLDGEVSQKSKSEFLSATDLVRIGNKWRVENKLEPLHLPAYYQTKAAKEFIAELEELKGCKVKISGRGRGKHTWVHPLLFIDIALQLNPKFKVQIYDWLYDHLLRNRNISGESYKLMSGSLWKYTTSQTKFRFEMINVSKKISKALGVKDWNEATEEQLSKRDEIHKSISLLATVLKDNSKAVELGIDHIVGKSVNLTD